MPYTKVNIPTLYTLTCIANGRVYIGVTDQLNRRISQHKSKLRHGIHRSRQLQADFNEMGADYFVFDEVATFPNKIEAHRVEKYYTDFVFGMNRDVLYNTYNGGMPYFSYGSNVKPTAECLRRSVVVNKGSSPSVETLRKRSIALKGRVFSDETKAKLKLTCHLSKKVIDNSTGIIYNSLADANAAYPEVKYATLRSWLINPHRTKIKLAWL